MTGNKIADKITIVSNKKPAKELANDEAKEKEDVEITSYKKRYISPEERQQVIDELSLVPKKYVQIKVNIKRIRYISPEEIQQIIDELKLV